MKTHSRRMVAAALLAAMAMGSTAASAGEGGGQVSAQRAKLKAEWAEARARDAANPDASFVERLFGLDAGQTKVAATTATAQPKKN